MLELIVVIVLIGVLMLYAIDRVLRLQVDAERISVQYFIGTLNSAIQLHVAEIVVNHGVEALKTLKGDNPITYLDQPPLNYAGESSDVLANQLLPSNWYYDPSTNILFYTVKNIDHFTTDLTGTPRIRLKISLLYADNRLAAGDRRVRGVVLKSLDDYHWHNSSEQEQGR